MFDNNWLVIVKDNLRLLVSHRFVQLDLILLHWVPSIWQHLRLSSVVTIEVYRSRWRRNSNHKLMLRFNFSYEALTYDVVDCLAVQFVRNAEESHTD
jgi:hypothetical protein